MPRQIQKMALAVLNFSEGFAQNKTRRRQTPPRKKIQGKFHNDDYPEILDGIKMMMYSNLLKQLRLGSKQIQKETKSLGCVPPLHLILYRVVTKGPLQKYENFQIYIYQRFCKSEIGFNFWHDFLKTKMAKKHKKCFFLPVFELMSDNLMAI